MTTQRNCCQWRSLKNSESEKIPYNLCLMFLLLVVLFITPTSLAAQSVVEQQLTLLRDNNILNDQQAIDTLVKIGVPVVDKVLPLISGAKRDMKAALIETVGRIGDPRALPVLLKELDKIGLTRKEAETFADSYIRIMCLKALGDLGDKSAVSTLLKVTKSDDIYEKTHALVSLYLLDYHQRDSELEKILFGDNDNCRNIVVMALGRRGNTKAIPWLEKALNDSVWFVRASAVDSLSAIGDAKVVSMIKPLKQDRSPYVRQAAEDAMKKLRTQ